MTDSCSVSSGSVTSSTHLPDRILDLVDAIPSLLSIQIGKSTEIKHEQLNARVINIRNEIDTMKSQYITRRRIAEEGSSIVSLHERIISFIDQLENVNAAIQTEEARFVRLSQEIEKWPEEKQELEEELRFTQMSIANMKAAQSAKTNLPAKPRVQLKTRAVKSSSHKDENMARIQALQSKIREVQNQLDRSKVDDQLTDRIRMVHVCRGVIETSQVLSTETKSKLITLLIQYS